MPASFPSVTVNILSALTPQTPGERHILITGSMISGTASSGELIEDLLSDADFNNAFGRKSQIAIAGRAAIAKLSISKVRPKISAIGLTDNPSGVAATGNVIFSGTATAAETLTVKIDSAKKGVYSLDVSVGDTADDIGAALEALVVANLDTPVTASNTSGNVTLTANNAGTQGNNIGLDIRGTVPGILYTINAMSGGATDPVTTTLFDPVADKRYTRIVYPAEWGISTLTDFTEARFNVDNKIIDGTGISTQIDTYANHNSTVDALNQKSFDYISNKLVSKASTIDLGSITSITQVAGVATVTCAADHNLASGFKVTVSGANETEYNLSESVITVTGTTTFTYLVDSGATSPATGTFVIVANILKAYKGAIFIPPLVFSASAAALDLRLTEGSNTSSIVTNGKSLGGPDFGSIPYHNTPFTDFPIIETGDDFTDAEATELTNSGSWLFRNNPANTVVISQEAVTTYKTNALGDPDLTFKYQNYMDTLSISRDYIFSNWKADFSQHKLTDGDVIAGQPMVNRDIFIARTMAYYSALSGQDYALLRSGSENEAAFKSAMTDSLQITLVNGTITVEMLAPIVTQLRDIIANFTPTFE
jgi:phage tail sheath gpL-like